LWDSIQAINTYSIFQFTPEREVLSEAQDTVTTHNGQDCTSRLKFYNKHIRL